MPVSVDSRSTLRNNSINSDTSDRTLSESISSLSSYEKPLFLRVPTNFSVVTVPDTNSTVSGIAGPGRTVDSLLASAGRHLEQAIDRFAEHRLRLGPNMAALRLVSALHKAHVMFYGAKYALPCRSEYEKDSEDMSDICSMLIWVCNGICSQCKAPYVPYLIENDVTGSVHKALNQLVGYLRCVEDCG